MKYLIAVLMVVGSLMFMGCDLDVASAPASASGVQKATADVKVQANGLTQEQENVKRRIEQENAPGAIQHLYVLSAYSGQILIYSTVKGKVTSSGKRLTPLTVACMNGQYVGSAHEGFGVDFPGAGEKRTGEVLQDDGTYGSSIEYLYWWDAQGKYHQQYVTGGMILHISDNPMSFRGVVINVENK
jgi:hypothetical protein